MPLTVRDKSAIKIEVLKSLRALEAILEYYEGRTEVPIELKQAVKAVTNYKHAVMRM